MKQFILRATDTVLYTEGKIWTKGQGGKNFLSLYHATPSTHPFYFFLGGWAGAAALAGCAGAGLAAG